MSQLKKDAQDPVPPALMVDVLNHVFKFLDVDDLVNCRSVCTQWRNVVTGFLEKKIDEIEIKFQNLGTDKCYVKSMTSFMGMARNCPFNFRYFSFLEIPMSHPEIETFFNEFGSSITKLKLYYSDLSTNITSKQLADILTKKASSLTELIIFSLPESVIKNSIFPSTELMPELKIERIRLGYNARLPIKPTIFVRDLFHSCKMLKSLAIYESTFNALTMLSEHGSIENLEDLEIGLTHSNTTGILTRFETAPMKRFAMKGTLVVTSTQLLQDYIRFIDDHKDTWEHLELTFDSQILSQPRSKFYFAVLNKLKYLSMHFKNIDIELDYQKQFPNLVTLKFPQQFPLPDDFDKVFPVDGAPVQSLKNLEFSLPMTSRILRRLKQTFPNVVNLKMNSVPQEVLTELWITWPLLESLNVTILNQNVSSAGCLDSFFTGINEKNLLAAFMSRKSELLQSFIVDPSIKKLTKLKRLLIDHRGESDFKLSDVGAILSFIGLKELLYLQVADTVHKITRKGVNTLCHELQFGQLIERGQLILTRNEWDEQFNANEVELADGNEVVYEAHASTSSG